ncbi:MAG: hypothetical protein AB1597_08265 [Chloroflexota bacterium]
MDKAHEYRKTLMSLVDAIQQSIKVCKSDGRLKPVVMETSQTVVEKFDYSEEGAIGCQIHGKPIKKTIWWGTHPALVEEVKKRPEYEATSRILETEPTLKIHSEYILEKFIDKVANATLEHPDNADTLVVPIVTNLIKSLCNEPVERKAVVWLVGIVPQPNETRFFIDDMEVALRRTLKEDLETREFTHGLEYRHDTLPTAVLTLCYKSTTSQGLQEKVDESITVARLFRLSSVRWLSIYMSSESITDSMVSGRLGAGRGEYSLEKLKMQKEDDEKLRLFWQTIMAHLPRGFYLPDAAKVDFRDIAYARYCDALLHNGVWERRVANGVMGLEAIYLGPSEMQELSFRLRIRLAKVLGYLGFDIKLLQDVTNHAYEVRSKYVHGSQTSFNDRKKLEKTYGDIASFTRMVLDYLRISIIVMTMIRLSKDELLDLIDDALIDKRKETQLYTVLGSSTNLVSLARVTP